MKHVTLSALLGAGALLLIAQPAAAAAETAPIYKVTQEGLSADQGARLSEAFGIPNVLQPNGAFSCGGLRQCRRQRVLKKMYFSFANGMAKCE